MLLGILFRLLLGNDAVEPLESHDSLKETTDDPHPPLARPPVDAMLLQPRQVQIQGLKNMNTKHGEDERLDQPAETLGPAREVRGQESPRLRTGHNPRQAGDGEEVEADAEHDGDIGEPGGLVPGHINVAYAEALAGSCIHLDDARADVVPGRQGGLEVDNVVGASCADAHPLEGDVAERGAGGLSSREAAVVTEVVGEFS